MRDKEKIREAVRLLLDSDRQIAIDLLWGTFDFNEIKRQSQIEALFLIKKETFGSVLCYLWEKIWRS
jgi:hypothetical protein